MMVGDKVLLYPSHIIDTLTDNVGRSSGMEPFFGTIVTVSEISSTKKSFKIEGSAYWFSTQWINLKNISSKDIEILTSTTYIDQKGSFLGETFVIGNVQCFRDSKGVTHLLSQPLT